MTTWFACQSHHWNCRSAVRISTEQIIERGGKEICFCTKRNPDVNSSPAIRQCHESCPSNNNSIDRYLFNMARKIVFHKKYKTANASLLSLKYIDLILVSTAIQRLCLGKASKKHFTVRLTVSVYSLPLPPPSYCQFFVQFFLCFFLS